MNLARMKKSFRIPDRIPNETVQMIFTFYFEKIFWECIDKNYQLNITNIKHPKRSCNNLRLLNKYYKNMFENYFLFKFASYFNIDKQIIKDPLLYLLRKGICIDYYFKEKTNDTIIKALQFWEYFFIYTIAHNVFSSEISDFFINLGYLRYFLNHNYNIQYSEFCYCSFDNTVSLRRSKDKKYFYYKCKQRRNCNFYKIIYSYK
jgi:hypothetical protein